MTCEEAREGLSALLDGALAPAEAADVRAHAAACAACRAWRAEIEGVRNLLRSVDLADDEPAQTGKLGQGVVAAIGERRRARWIAWTAAGLVAAAMIAAVVRDAVVIRARNAAKPAVKAPPAAPPREPENPELPEAAPGTRRIAGRLGARTSDAATRAALRELFRSWPGTFAAKNSEDGGDFGMTVDYEGPAGGKADEFSKRLDEFQREHGDAILEWSLEVKTR